jgi:hypothetical protein
MILLGAKVETKVHTTTIIKIPILVKYSKVSNNNVGGKIFSKSVRSAA